MLHANLPVAARAGAAIERNQRLSGLEQNRVSAAEVCATWAIADIERIEFGCVQVLSRVEGLEPSFQV
jgi:hypothetical protein